MSGSLSSMKQWQLTIFAFSAFFIFIFAGFSPDVGREMSQREEFSYPDSDVWKASDRAEENMPEEYWLIFQIVMGNSTTSTTRLDIRFTDTTTYSATDNQPNGLKIFNDSNTDNGFAGIEIAATDGDDYYGSTLLKSIATGVNYSKDNEFIKDCGTPKRFRLF